MIRRTERKHGRVLNRRPKNRNISLFIKLTVCLQLVFLFQFEIVLKLFASLFIFSVYLICLNFQCLNDDDYQIDKQCNVFSKLCVSLIPLVFPFLRCSFILCFFAEFLPVSSCVSVHLCCHTFISQLFQTSSVTLTLNLVLRASASQLSYGYPTTALPQLETLPEKRAPIITN